MEFLRGWSSRDRGLAEALTELEDQRCGGCGQKRELAWDPDTNGWWDHHEVTCEACAELERAKAEAKDPEPGAKGYVVFNNGRSEGGASGAVSRPGHEASAQER